ncbi:AAA family ATPase [bacterium]|nr:AAA family ATPase [bacterium]
MRRTSMIVLLGSRGAGKTAVAREVARALSCEAVELDAAIEAAAGKSITRIFQEDGEPRFRDLEERALADALARPGAAVISPGGGIVVREKNRELIAKASALVVYLAAKSETLAARVERDRSAGHDRPALVPGGALAEARALLLAREAHFRALASLTV